MWNKYGKDGFGAMSVSLDDPAEKKARDKVLAFLTRVKATFPNFILEDKVEDWQKQLKVDGPPLVVVYGRDGKEVKRFELGVEYTEVEKVVAELLKQK